MKNIVLALAAPVLLLSCNNPAAKKLITTPAQKDSINQPSSFFPVPDYIGGQIKMIDSLQLPLSKSVTINKKTTLEAVSDREFRSLALNFQHPDINDPSIKNYYKETSIADQSIPSVTLIYTSVDTALPIQKINVFIKPDPVKNDRVTGIYIEKLFMLKDTSFNQKLYWKTDRNFQLITEKKINGKTLPLEQVKIIWDPVE